MVPVPGGSPNDQQQYNFYQVPVIEISLILLLVFGSFACAAGLARWNSALALGGVEQGRILSAIGRTSDGFFWRTLQKALPSVVLVALGLVLLRPLIGLASTLLAPAPESGAASPLLIPGDIAWGLGFALAGLAGTAVVGFLAVHSTLRVASRLLEATRDGLEHGLLVLLRGSAISALIGDGIAALLVATALVLRSGEFVTLGLVPAAQLKTAVCALPGLAVGALLMAWAFHASGAVFSSSAKLARRAVRILHPDIDDEHDPSLIANLAATHLGAVVSRTLLAFLSALIGQIVTLVLCASALLDRPGVAVAPLALLVLPILARVMGLLAAAVGILATRVDAAQDLGAAVLRGIVATLVVSMGGLGGACYWLLGVHWVAGFVPGAIGCAMGASLGFVLTRHTRQRSEALSAEQLGQDTSALSKVAVSVEAGALTIVLAALAISAAYLAGALSPLPNGGLFALLMLLAGMGSISAFMSTLNVADPLANNVQAIAQLRFAELPNEARRCAQLLRRALFAPACSGQAFQVLLGALTILLVALCTVQLDASGEYGRAALGVPAVLWAGILGSTVVLGSCGLLLHTIAGTTRSTVRDMLGQLLAKSEHGFTPNYKSTVDAGADATLARSHRLLLIALVVPALIAATVRLAAGAGSILAPQCLLTFSTFAGVTALAVGLILQSLCAAQSQTLRRSIPQHEQQDWSTLDEQFGSDQDAHLRTMTQTGQALSSFSPAFAELGGDSVSPTLQLQAASIAVVCLLFSPLLA
jgi:Na+/H+-translocating membrane pyrophosphatase